MYVQSGPRRSRRLETQRLRAIEDAKPKAPKKPERDIPPNQLATERAVSKAYGQFLHFEFEANGRTVYCVDHSFLNGMDQLAMTYLCGDGQSLWTPRVYDFVLSFNSLEPLVQAEDYLHRDLPSRIEDFHALLKHKGFPRTFGGNGMGARGVAIAAGENHEKPEGLVLLSYPLRSGEDNSGHQILLDIPEEIDVLFIVGDKDESCDIAELNSVRKQMKAKSWLVVVTGVDFNVKETEEIEARTMSYLRYEIGRMAAVWLAWRDQKKRYRLVTMDPETECVTVRAWARG